MIEGVEIKKLKVIPDKRGFLMEMLRNDDKMLIANTSPIHWQNIRGASID